MGRCGSEPGFEPPYLCQHTALLPSGNFPDTLLPYTVLVKSAMETKGPEA